MRLRLAAACLPVLFCCMHASAVAADAKVEATFESDALVLSFSEGMQTWGNDVRDLVRLEPALPVSCAWEDDTRIYCVPESERMPAKASRYRVHVGAGLKTQAGLAMPARALIAETERPTLSAEIERWNGRQPDIVLTSNVAAAPEAVAAALRLNLDGISVDVPPLQAIASNGSWDRRHRYRLALPIVEARNVQVALSAVPGLRSNAGPLRGTQDGILLRVLANEPFHLRGVVCAGRESVVSVAPDHGQARLGCMPGEAIRLLFSQPLQEAAYKAWIASWPAAMRTSRPSTGTESYWRHRRAASAEPALGPASWVEFKVGAAHVDLLLPLEALRSRDGDALVPVDVHVRTGDFRPALRAAHARTLVADPDAMPALVEAINASQARVEVHGVGTRDRSEAIVVSSPPDNQPVAVASDVLSRTLQEGGWVSWSPRRAAKRDESGSSLRFAAPGFDLFAVSGRREVLAWANTWEGFAVAGAEVELLWMDPARDAAPRLIARGRTQADGTALLTLPEDLVVERPENGAPQWMLRAATGRRMHAPRAVLPLDEQTWNFQLGRSAEQKLWGVADRPLYRAGDTVRYHLWLRDAAGGRLLRPRRAEPVALRLARLSRDETILGWTATPDADGGISGELVLPVHLPDETYCIGAGSGYEPEGSCFYVGTYRAQDLWAQARVEDRVLREGDRLRFDVSAGYYSGGAAAGVPLASVDARLERLPLREAYPRHARFHFIDAGDRTAGIAGLDAVKLATDKEGRAHGDVPLRIDRDSLPVGTPLPAFGRIRLSAEVKLSDREGTVTNEATTRYTRFDRFVGLRLEPSWLDARSPVTMEGIVIDADGEEIADAPIDVEVHYLPGFGPGGADAGVGLLKQCSLRAQQAIDCSFPRTRSGRYRITARSGDSAPVELIQPVWVEGDTGRTQVRETSLEWLDKSVQRGGKVHVMLKQPHARAQVLFTFVSGDRIVGHQVGTATGAAQGFGLATAADWPRQLHLRAHVRDAASGQQTDDGLRKPPVIDEAQLDLSLDHVVDAVAPVALALSAAHAKPGETVRLSLRNDSMLARTVVLAVLDDALRTLGAGLLPHFDPNGHYWLGDDDAYPRIAKSSFSGWNDRPWRWWLPWPGSRAADTPEPRQDCSALQGSAAAACAAANAAQAAADAAAVDGGQFDLGFGAINPIDVSSVESTAILTAEQMHRLPASRDVTEVALLAPGTAKPASAPPPPQEPAVVFDDPSPVDVAASADASSLDTVTVLGSSVSDPEAARPSGPPRQRPALLRALARVRTQFADTALWMPDIRLAPGESREIELKLPDNLTRWRAVAWSSDADDGFAMAEATVEAGLLVESRLQAPVRLYPGDRSRLAANVRQAGDSPVQAEVGLRSQGSEGAQEHTGPLSLQARGQGSFGMEIAPKQSGALLVTASVATPAGADAVAAPIDVATRWISARKVQAGWLGSTPLQLDLPQLPATASDVQLRLSLLRGGAGLVEQWTEDLRDYAHRCWEQILSRAVAAALTIERGDGTAWPEAAAVVREALDNAAVFQDESGDFRYFANEPSSERIDEPRPQVALTAYTLDGLALLRGLGHPVPAAVEEKARQFLREFEPEDEAPDSFDEAAFAAAGGAHTGEALDAIWKRWDQLSLPGRIATARALAQAGHRMAATAKMRLLEAAPLRGHARVVSMPRRFDQWMSSALREQCALVDLLRDYPQLVPDDAQHALLAGMTDLYAGGIEAVDTQTGAVCLLALRNMEGSTGAIQPIKVRIANHVTELSLSAGQDRNDWSLAAPAEKTLQLSPTANAAVPLSFIAELSYREDASQVRSAAIGFALERRHEVLRDRRWQSVAGLALREGDWIRVTLTLNTGSPRYFVAITDDVPGGLRPTDLSLGAVAGLDLKALSDTGSYWFDTRKLDPRSPRFYAEHLPAGRHEIHYFARIGNSGDYLAAPALAELMYGSATRARTGSTRLHVEEAAKPAP